MGTHVGESAGALDALWYEPRDESSPEHDAATAIPHVIAWNLTRRCNLACAHCYISAGSWHAQDEELGTNECRRVIDQILETSPSPLLILSGGEPLVREDLEDIARYATAGGATVVVGTNGTGLTDDRISSLMRAGVQGVALSIDSLDARYHDRFRHGEGALEDTLAAVDRLGEHGLDFLVQFTITKGNRDELDAIVAFADEKGAVCVNVYFLVETGRGEGMHGLGPDGNDEVLRRLTELQREYRGRVMIRSKCQPQLMRHVYERDAESPLLHYRTRCPCGVQYCRITPDGKVTPCPYMPEVAGDLGARSFGEIWRESKVFKLLREGDVGGKCGRCEYRAICGGCRARAHAIDGDFLAEDPDCAYEPAVGVATPVRPARAITYGDAPTSRLAWDAEAEARLAAIPSFVRGVVAGRVEKYASEAGYERVTLDVMREVRETMPVDFSKKVPFFARGRRGAQTRRH
ncbi:MAG: radical SAM protein [Gemmatimonadetes bacterium]|nr:radical SAM protein [Gemmatimonadota bacterium]